MSCDHWQTLDTKIAARDGPYMLRKSDEQLIAGFQSHGPSDEQKIFDLLFINWMVAKNRGKGKDLESIGTAVSMFGGTQAIRHLIHLHHIHKSSEMLTIRGGNK